MLCVETECRRSFVGTNLVHHRSTPLVALVSTEVLYTCDGSLQNCTLVTLSPRLLYVSTWISAPVQA